MFLRKRLNGEVHPFALFTCCLVLITIVSVSETGEQGIKKTKLLSEKEIQQQSQEIKEIICSHLLH